MIHLKPAVLTLAILSLLISACSVPGIALQPVAAVHQNAVLTLVSVPPGATATPTPFQPIPPTAIFLPTELPTVTPTPLPTATPLPTPTATPPPISQPETAGIEEPKGVVQILLLGSDERSGGGGFRTDSIMLATLNPKDGYVSLTSFPRDLYITIPGWGENRINTAWQVNGFRSLADTFEYNFRIRPQHYVLISFHTFNQFIDSLGGIDVNVAVKYTDRRPGYANLTIPAGVNHMDGKTALWYARARKASNDFSRSRRQQEVLIAIADKLLTVDGLKRVPEFYEVYKDSVQTDLGLRDLLSFLPLAGKIAADRSRLHHHFIGPEQVWDWITPGGGMVLLPNYPAIDALLRKAIKGK